MRAIKTGLFSKFPELLFYSMLFVLLLFSGRIYDQYQLAKSSAFIFFLLSFLLITIFAKIHIVFKPALIAFILFFLWLMKGILTSNLNPQFYYVLTLCSSAAFLAPLYIKPDIKKFLVFINALVFFPALYGLIQLILGQMRPFSFFGNPIFFGEFLMLNLPLLFVSFYYFRENRMAVFINIMFCLPVMMLTLSRGVFLSFLVSLVFLLYYLFKNSLIDLKKFRFSKTYLAFSAVLVIYMLTVPAVFRSIEAGFKRTTIVFKAGESALKNRILMSQTALEMIKDSPLNGLGVGAVKYYYQKEQAKLLDNENYNYVQTSYIHNDYLQLASELGITGILLFAAFFLLLFFSFDRVSPYMPDEKYVFVLALCASVIGILVESFFNFPLFIMPGAAFFWIYCGMIYSFINTQEDSFKSGAVAHKILSVAAVLLLVLVLFRVPFDFISNFHLKYAMNKDIKYIPGHDIPYKRAVSFNPRNFYNYAYLGVSYANSREYKEAIEAYKKALDIYPYSPDMLFNLGMVYKMAKDYKTAEKYLKDSIDLYPGFAMAHLQLAKLYIDEKNQSESSKEFFLANKYGMPVEELDNKLILFKEVTK